MSKEGKRPISEKQPQAPIGLDTFGNVLEIPADIQSDLTSRGLVGRWINAKKAQDMGGYNPRGWAIYRRPKELRDTIGFGNDPDGIVRRGDCVLAVKTIADHAKHKGFLKAEASKKLGAKAKQAHDLRAAIKSSGLSSSVSDSYDDDEEQRIKWQISTILEGQSLTANPED